MQDGTPPGLGSFWRLFRCACKATAEGETHFLSRRRVNISNFRQHGGFATESDSAKPVHDESKQSPGDSFPAFQWLLARCKFDREAATLS